VNGPAIAPALVNFMIIVFGITLRSCCCCGRCTRC
jgi:hypothetical protein